MTTTADVEAIRRICKDCGDEFGYRDLVKQKQMRDGVTALCLGCNLRRRKAREAGALVGWEPFEAPDPTPARRLRRGWRSPERTTGRGVTPGEPRSSTPCGISRPLAVAPGWRRLRTRPRRGGPRTTARARARSSGCSCPTTAATS